MTTTTNSVAIFPRRKNQPRSIIVFLTAIVAAILPMLVGVALLLSLVTDRPTLVREGQWWWNPARQFAGASDAVVRRITLWWGIAFLIVAALQGFAVILGISITNPIGVLVRSLGALAVEAAFVTMTFSYLRNRHEMG
jgi:hypothetical protein